jgi:hypothetical protein
LAARAATAGDQDTPAPLRSDLHDVTLAQPASLNAPIGIVIWCLLETRD